MRLQSSPSPIDGRGLARILSACRLLSIALWTAGWAAQAHGQSGTVALTSALNPAFFGQSVTLQAMVQAGAAGNLTFSDSFQGSTVTLAQLPVDASGAATLSIATLGVGVHSLSACFLSSSGATPLCSTGNGLPPLLETILESTQTSLQSSLNPLPLGANVTFTATVTANAGGLIPGGTVSFSNGMNTLCSAVALSAQTAACTALPAQLIQGSNYITAIYAGDPSRQILGSSAALSEDVQSTASVALVAQPNPSDYGAAVVFTVTVSPGGTAAATGSAGIYDGGQQIGSAPLAGTSNQGSFSTTTLSAGSHTMTALYPGDVNYASVRSPALIQVVNAPPPPPSTSDFSLGTAPDTITIPTTEHTTVTVSLVSIDNFADTVNLGCAALPANVSCYFSNATVKLAAGGTENVQLTIDTNNPPGGGAIAANRAHGQAQRLLGFLALPLFACLGCAGLRWRRNGIARVLLIALACAAVLVSGCSSVTAKSAAPGSYTMQVTGVGATTGISHLHNLQLTITQ
jgi:hypothetical protein